MDYVDIYCERGGPGLWAEPLNAVTNLAFLIAAAILTRDYARATRGAGGDVGIAILIGLIWLIGIGSALFHTLATRWAEHADVAPIAMFILLYTYAALRRFVGTGPWLGIAGIAAVLAGGAVLGSYLAALIAMAGIGGWLRFGPRHPAGRALLAAAGIFTVSLTFRTLDGPLCAVWPSGTHFLWHMLNAVVLYLVTRAMMRFGSVTD